MRACECERASARVCRACVRACERVWGVCEPAALVPSAKLPAQVPGTPGQVLAVQVPSVISEQRCSKFG